MLDNNGFNLWANDYDKEVGISNEDNTYPFAGYKSVLNKIYNEIRKISAKNILDIGFGTGTLTKKLYENGYIIYGQDFSDKMVEIAQNKMSNAKLYNGDFSKGLVKELKENKYDVIIATYSLHHLTDMQKIKFINNELMPLLNDDGIIYIGDIAFETKTELEECKNKYIADWDNDEIYWVYNEIKDKVISSSFEKMSECAGIIKIKKGLIKMNINYKENIQNVKEFNYLYDAVGWGHYTDEVSKKALSNTLYSVSIYDDKKIIGYGRIIGDGACFLYIQDVMVIPEYQSKKIGSMIIEKLMIKINKIKEEIPNIIVCLVATTGKEGFYQKLGFTKLEDTDLGTCMILK